MTRRVILGLIFLVGAALGPAPAWAGPGDGVVIDVSGAKRGAYPIAVPVGVASDPAAAKVVADVTSFDLGVAGLFKVLDPASFLADLGAEQLGLDPQKWKDVGAYGVIKYRVTTTGDAVDIEFRLYEVSKGGTAQLSKTYRGKKAELRRLVHAWCNEVVKYYTGEPGFFGSKIAFVVKKRGQSQVFAMDFDGANPYSVSRNSSINMLPSWSRSGGQLLYTSYMRNNPDLYVVGAGGGRAKRLSAQRGMNTGGAWSPDGSQIAVTLSKDGNPEIYIISAADGAVVRRLTNDRGIDTSPAWSADGREIAFVSDREGGPQIFVVAAGGGAARRVSSVGNYNTTPTWSPKKGARVLAYTTRDGGSYDIVTLDLDSKKMTRITQGEGNNEEPSFAPGGRAIAFASTRAGGSGVYIANADGSGKAIKVWSGAATGVDWGPAPTP
ncbi:MAG: Tol-Pal system beta propeller repeat protein TolB [Kofleriaceae bacterium]|nr:Tol-Pal system beta propeller repeat protein TolB [Kofleriaceae bacterium]